MAGYIKITSVQAKKIMDTENNIRIVDVRTEEEHNDGYIFDSICLPLEDIEEKAEKVLADKNERILVYCRSGKRSMEACEKLAAMGYNDVLDFGGIIDWNFEIVY